MIVDVHGLVGFSDAEKKVFMEKVVPLLEKVVNSDEFKERVLEYSYFGNKGFVDNRGLARPAIYRRFISGADKFNTAEDQDLDLFLSIFYSRRSTIGYTYPSTFKTWVNRRFFSWWLKSDTGRCNIIGNIVHEYMHNLGFDHAVRWNKLRDHSVPYAYGNIAKEIALKKVKDDGSC